MGNIIPLDVERHRELRDLLPWYATGQLEAADRERVEAHLVSCAECQAEVRFEQRLDSEIARLPIDVDQSWSRLREKMDRDRPQRVLGRLAGTITAPAPWLGWAAAASVLLLATVFLLPANLQADRYHVLGAQPAAAIGNAVVIFRPETREKDVREALIASGARLVDGPTATGGYILHVAAASRDAAVAKLLARDDVAMAAAIDSGAAR